MFDDNYEVKADEPLLEVSAEGLLPSGRHRHRSFWRPCIIFGGFIVFVAYSIFLVAVTSQIGVKQRLYGTRFLGSPLKDFIRYEPRIFSLVETKDQDKYFSPTPSEEVDWNWYNLLEKQNIALSPEIMKDLGRVDQGLKLPDGNYFGALMVFHHLHCLKTIYYRLHPEYYTQYVNKTGHDKAMQDFHTAHCLHMLKEAVMCQADPSLLTMKWSEHGPLPIGNLSSPHECVNWDRLQEWIEPHSFDPVAEGMLVHPKFGPTFKDGKWVEFDPV